MSRGRRTSLRRQFATRTLAAVCWATTTASPAANYVFGFEPGESRFSPDRAANRSAVESLLPLLQQYGGAAAFRFVLTGNVPDTCIPTCREESLLRQRVDAVIGAASASPSAAPLLAQLRWQPVPYAEGTASAEELRLGIELLESPPSSTACPYEAAIADPRLPPVIARASDNGRDWVPVNGLPTVPLSANAIVRVKTLKGARMITVLQGADPAAKTMLAAGAGQAQWSATQMQWTAAGAEVEIGFGAQTRGIGDTLQPWNDPPADADGNPDDRTCRIRFTLMPGT